jgi:polyisoprenoid-binding protein YceI
LAAEKLSARFRIRTGGFGNSFKFNKSEMAINTDSDNLQKSNKIYNSQVEFIENLKKFIFF